MYDIMKDIIDNKSNINGYIIIQKSYLNNKVYKIGTLYDDEKTAYNEMNKHISSFVTEINGYGKDELKDYYYLYDNNIKVYIQTDL